MLKQMIAKITDALLLLALLCGPGILSLETGLVADRAFDAADHRLAPVAWIYDASTFTEQTNGLILQSLILAQNRTIDLTGDWQLTWNTPFGSKQFGLHIDQRGSQLYGSADGRQLTGTIRDDQVNFTIEAPIGRTFAFTGLASNGRMSGLTGMGRPWTAQSITTSRRM